MLTNTKQFVKTVKFKILKNKNKQKNSLGIWWIGTCHQNLVSIDLTVSDKTMSTSGRTDDRRRTTDVHVMTVALLYTSTKQS